MALELQKDQINTVPRPLREADFGFEFKKNNQGPSGRDKQLNIDKPHHQNGGHQTRQGSE